jgi:type I restriction enzyme S subunit
VYPKNTLIVALYGEGKTRGKVSELLIPAAINQALAALVMKGEAKDCRAFVKAFLQSRYAALRQQAAGGMQPNLNLGLVKKIRVPIAPLDEQRRIITKIEELFSDLDAGVAALERVRAKLKRYRASVLKAAIEGRLTEEWRARHPHTERATELLDRILKERRRRWGESQRARFAEARREPPKDWQAKYQEPAGPDTTALPGLPEGWCWATVDQLAEIQGGIQKQPKRAPVNNAYPFLRVANVYRGRLDLSEVHQIELFDGELVKLRLQAGDMLVVEGNGSITEIGRSAIWTGEIANCVHQNHIIRVRLLLCEPRFFDAYWNSPFGNRKVMEVAASTSGLYTLSVSKVSSLPVPLPPLDEQAEIVREVEARLSVVDQLAAQVEANLKRAARLRQGILKQAFDGRLVPQDPTDEPAEQLLQRISSKERQTVPTTG